MKLRRGMRALVTGASFGLGEAFAEGLAARGLDLLLVARTDARLLPLAADLAARFGVSVEIVLLDQVEEDAPTRLHVRVDELQFEPDLLVQAARSDPVGSFAEQPYEQVAESLRLDMEAPVALMRHYLPRMAARGSGAVVNVASSAAFAPIPARAVRAASDAFLLALGSALWAEQRRNGVAVVTICVSAVAGRPNDPGAQREQGDGGGGRSRFPTRAAVVERALAAVERGDPVVLPAGGLRVAPAWLGMLPPRARVRAAAWLARRYPSMLVGPRRRER